MNLPSRRTLFLITFGVTFLSAFGWVVATQGPLASVKVTTAVASESTLERTLFGIGTVEARRAYAIGPTVAGRVARVLVDQGDVVKAGQLLAEMDPVPTSNRVSPASGASAARARQLVTAAQAALAETTSRARLAQNSAATFRRLAAQEILPVRKRPTPRRTKRRPRGPHRSRPWPRWRPPKRKPAEPKPIWAGGQSRAHLRLSQSGGRRGHRTRGRARLDGGGRPGGIAGDRPGHALVARAIDQGRSNGLAVGLPADTRCVRNPARCCPDAWRGSNSLAMR